MHSGSRNVRRPEDSKISNNTLNKTQRFNSSEEEEEEEEEEGVEDVYNKEKRYIYIYI